MTIPIAAFFSETKSAPMKKLPNTPGLLTWEALKNVLPHGKQQGDEVLFAECL
jgi:phosphoserine aminotransferase